MKEAELKKLFETDLNYLYNMEKQISKLLPKIQKNSDSEKVKQLVKDNIEKNGDQIDRITKIFSFLDKKLGGKKSLGISGLIAECSEIMEKTKNSDSMVYNVSLLASLQRIKHYQIGAYDTLTSYSKLLDLKKISEHLNKSLVEEKDINRKLKSVIKSLVKISD